MGVCHIQTQRARMNGTDNYLLIVSYCGIGRGGFDPFLRHIAVNSHKALPGLQAASTFKSEAGEIELAACLTEPSSTPEAMFPSFWCMCFYSSSTWGVVQTWSPKRGCSPANGGLRCAIPNSQRGCGLMWTYPKWGIPYTQKILGCWGMLVDHWVLRHYRFKRIHLEVDQYPRWAAKESV